LDLLEQQERAKAQTDAPVRGGAASPAPPARGTSVMLAARSTPASSTSSLR